MSHCSTACWGRIIFTATKQAAVIKALQTTPGETSADVAPVRLRRFRKVTRVITYGPLIDLVCSDHWEFLFLSANACKGRQRLLCGVEKKRRRKKRVNIDERQNGERQNKGCEGQLEQQGLQWRLIRILFWWTRFVLASSHQCLPGNYSNTKKKKRKPKTRWLPGRKTLVPLVCSPGSSSVCVCFFFKSPSNVGMFSMFI